MNNYTKKSFSVLVLLVMSMGATAQTTVQFSAASAMVTEAGASVDLTIDIANENVVATTVDVVLTSGFAADIAAYSTQTATFPTSSAVSQTVTVTITDDVDIESAETLTFTLQNVGGGNAAVLGAQTTFNLTIIDNDITVSKLIINEIHADPASSLSGDANGDGIRNTLNDEFIEFVNTDVAPLDISGYEIFDTNSRLGSRHVVPSSTIIPAGGAFVVFGGGTLTGSFGGSVVQTASTGSIGATNSSETFIIQDAADNTLIYYTYGSEGGDNQSITREPDLTGGDSPLTKHSMATGSGGSLFSPGTKIDGSFFIEQATTLVQFNSPSISLNEADGTFDIDVTLSLPDGSSATTVDVALSVGDAADFDGYTTKTVTFPAGSSDKQTVPVTITDDTDIEGEQSFTFILQNVAGGNNAAIGATGSFTVTMGDNDFPPSNLILNEFLPYPSSTSILEPAEVDANGDGTLGGTSDEMMEFVNGGETTLDISGWKIHVNKEDRHFFPSGSIIAPGAALVLFGGGSPVGSFGGATVQVASEAISGLGILNSGTMIKIFDESNVETFSYIYSSTELGVSYTRNPDLTGNFAPHPVLNGLTISPGTHIDGTPFAVDNSTRVAFATSLGGKEEGDTSFEIAIAIENADATNATTADVILSSDNTNGDLVYATQTVTFPAGSSEHQKVTLTIVQDTELEGDELFTFALQNISGGDKAKSGTISQFNFIVLDDDVPLIFNEIHADPASGDAGDANNDGMRDSSEDEFIEVVNRSTESIDMSGYKFQDESVLRHVFPDHTILQPGHAIVVFGGGSPKGILGAAVQVASEGKGLSLTNSGDNLSIFNKNDEIQGSTIYGADAANDQSITRLPDITGGYALHTDAPGAEGRLYSPGRKVDGSLFINVVNATSELSVDQVLIYPNPVSDYLKIKVDSQSEGLKFNLFNIDGRMIREFELNSSGIKILSILGIPKGLYLYEVKDINSESLKKGKVIIEK